MIAHKSCREERRNAQSAKATHIMRHLKQMWPWKRSTTLETAFCTEALQETLENARPEIFNSDQDIQFTCQEFTNILFQHMAY